MVIFGQKMVQTRRRLDFYVIFKAIRHKMATKKMANVYSHLYFLDCKPVELGEVP